MKEFSSEEQNRRELVVSEEIDMEFNFSQAFCLRRRFRFLGGETQLEKVSTVNKQRKLLWIHRSDGNMAI